MRMTPTCRRSDVAAVAAGVAVAACALALAGCAESAASVAAPRARAAIGTPGDFTIDEPFTAATPLSAAPTP